MKTLFFILSIFIPASAATVQAQEMLLNTLPLQNGAVTYTEVVQAENTSKDELYIRAKRWIAAVYKSANAVIQLDDKTAGELMGKGYFTTTWQVTFYAYEPIAVHHTLTLQVKEGRWRYEFTGFRVKYNVQATQYTIASTVDMPLETWNQSRKDNLKKVLLKIDEQMQALIASLKAEMQTPAASNADW